MGMKCGVRAGDGIATYCRDLINALWASGPRKTAVMFRQLGEMNKRLTNDPQRSDGLGDIAKVKGRQEMAHVGRSSSFIFMILSAPWTADRGRPLLCPMLPPRFRCSCM
nr:hypothetical protein CFP56_55997 [Quercus suber]